MRSNWASVGINVSNLAEKYYVTCTHSYSKMGTFKNTWTATRCNSGSDESLVVETVATDGNCQISHKHFKVHNMASNQWREIHKCHKFVLETLQIASMISGYDYSKYL